MDSSITIVESCQVISVIIKINRILTTIFIVIFIIILVIAFFAFRNIFKNSRVLEGENGQDDFLICDDSTTNITTKDTTMRGREVNPKEKGRWRGGFGKKGILVVIKVATSKRKYVEWPVGHDSRDNISDVTEGHRGNGTKDTLDGKASLVSPSNVKNGLNDVTS